MPPYTFTQLKGTRVKLTQRDGTEVTGVMKGVTPTRIWIDEIGVDSEEVEVVQEAPLFCATCHRSVFRLFDPHNGSPVFSTAGICADCYRKEAAKRPAPQEPCEVCGRAAVRQPGTDQFLCTTHHAEAGNKLNIMMGDADILADCISDDVSSDKHSWRQVKGARFRCIRCRRAEKWDPELLRSLRGEDA